MTKYIWHDEAVPDNLAIKQVHAVLVTPDQRILLRIKNDTYRITGGHPETQDADFRATIRREATEEADVTVSKIDYIGYQEVFDGNEHYAQMRAVALVDKINPATPDPDRNGSWTYGRILTTPDDARKNLPFGDINQHLIDNALRIATEKQYFTEPQNTTKELLNPEDKQSPDED